MSSSVGDSPGSSRRQLAETLLALVLERFIRFDLYLDDVAAHCSKSE
jgi:hypothetical protein